MARSTFFYYKKQFNLPDKYESEKKVITEIFHQNKGRYGYRRITLELRNRGMDMQQKVGR